MHKNTKLLEISRLFQQNNFKQTMLNIILDRKKTLFRPKQKSESLDADICLFQSL